MGTPISEIVEIVRDKMKGKSDDDEDVDENNDVDEEEEEDDVEAQKPRSRSKKGREHMSGPSSSVTMLVKQFLVTGLVSAGTLGMILSSDSFKLINADTGKINLITILIIAGIISGLTILISRFL